MDGGYQESSDGSMSGGKKMASGLTNGLWLAWRNDGACTYSAVVLHIVVVLADHRRAGLGLEALSGFSTRHVLSALQLQSGRHRSLLSFSAHVCSLLSVLNTALTNEADEIPARSAAAS